MLLKVSVSTRSTSLSLSPSTAPSQNLTDTMLSAHSHVSLARSLVSVLRRAHFHPSPPTLLLSSPWPFGTRPPTYE